MIHIAWKWEKIDDTTYRVKVIGGWWLHYAQNDRIIATTFISDPNHEWIPEVV